MRCRTCSKPAIPPPRSCTDASAAPSSLAHLLCSPPTVGAAGGTGAATSCRPCACCYPRRRAVGCHAWPRCSRAAAAAAVGMAAARRRRRRLLRLLRGRRLPPHPAAAALRHLPPPGSRLRCAAQGARLWAAAPSAGWGPACRRPGLQCLETAGGAAGAAASAGAPAERRTGHLLVGRLGVWGKDSQGMRTKAVEQASACAKK